MPNYNNYVYIVSDATSDIKEFTASDDGWLHINARGTGTDLGQVTVTINNIYTLVICAQVNYMQQTQIIPIRKGDIVKCNPASGQIRNIIFLPNM